MMFFLYLRLEGVAYQNDFFLAYFNKFHAQINSKPLCDM